MRRLPPTPYREYRPTALKTMSRKWQHRHQLNIGISRAHLFHLQQDAGTDKIKPTGHSRQEPGVAVLDGLADGASNGRLEIDVRLAVRLQRKRGTSLDGSH